MGVDHKAWRRAGEVPTHGMTDGNDLEIVMTVAGGCQ